MDFYFLFPMASAILNIAVGYYVFSKNPKAALNRRYMMATAWIAIWNLGDLSTMLSNTPAEALTARAVSDIGGAIACTAILHFFLTFSKSGLVAKKSGVFLLYLPTIICIGAILAHLRFIVRLSRATAWGIYLSPDLSYYLVSFCGLAYLLASGAVCWRFHRTAALASEKIQSGLFTVAMLFLSLLGTVTDLVIPTFYPGLLPPLASSTSALMAMCIAYIVSRWGFATVTPGMAADKIIETMTDSLIALDREGFVSFVNDATLSLLGRKPEDLIGRPFGTMSFKQALLLRESALVSPVRDFETEVQDQTGKSVPVSVNASVMKDRRNRITGLILVTRDISQHKRQMDIIDEQRRRMTAILQCIGDGVFVVDREGRIILTNPAALRMVRRIDGEDVSGRHFTEIFRFVTGRSHETVGDFVSEAVVRQTVTHAPFKTDLATTTGGILPVAVSAAPLIGSTGIFGGVVIIHDERHEREIAELKDEFISIASHQLKAPLTAIRWLLETVLGGDGGELTEQQKETIGAALESNLRLIGLVKDLLNVSRIEDGRVGINPVPTDLDRLCSEVLAEIEPLAAKKNVAIKNGAVCLGILNIDPKLIFQALANILSNAVKYSKPGGVVSFVGTRRESDVLLTCNDDGIGIPSGQQKMVFDKFFRAGNAAASGAEGTGLGLFVVKSIVESSGGRVWFESAENRGTTFSVVLPLSGSRSRTGDRGLDK